jgi:hypothetical protein
VKSGIIEFALLAASFPQFSFGQAISFTLVTTKIVRTPDISAGQRHYPLFLASPQGLLSEFFMNVFIENLFSLFLMAGEPKSCLVFPWLTESRAA